jgi:hypothetical protein
VSGTDRRRGRLHLGNGIKVPPPAFVVGRMRPVAIIEHEAECIASEHGQIREGTHEHILDPCVMQGAGKIVMVDDIGGAC